MTEEVQVLAEVDPAPEQAATAAPAPDVGSPEVTDDQSSPAKTFTQEELDAAIGKRLAREQRKWEREQQTRVAETQTRLPVPKDVPSVDQFESPAEYADALAYRKAEELIESRERQKAQAAVADAYHEREEEARTKYDDFEQVAYNPSIRITEVMAETIRASDIGPEVAYYLGANAKEADRISRLPPLSQAKEIGRLEARLADNPPVKRTTSAPAPLSPVNARSSNTNPSFDTTDPRSVKSMSASEWIEADRARQMRKLQAQNTR